MTQKNPPPHIRMRRAKLSLLQTQTIHLSPKCLILHKVLTPIFRQGAILQSLHPAPQQRYLETKLRNRYGRRIFGLGIGGGAVNDRGEVQHSAGRGGPEEIGADEDGVFHTAAQLGGGGR